jgi:hypothetical protein
MVRRTSEAANTDDRRDTRDGSGDMSLAIWKGLSLTLALLLLGAFAAANFVFKLRFREWPGVAQFLFILGAAMLCVAVARYVAKRSSLGMD